MEKLRVLFLCVHNSARSQMAEAYLNGIAGDRFSAESAGLEPGSLNPYMVEVMAEDGYDTSNNKIKDVFEFYKEGKIFEYVITVCDKTAAERCPIFPGVKEKINWSFQDPAKLQGSKEEILKQTRIIRDQIKEQIEEWVKNIRLQPSNSDSGKK